MKSIIARLGNMRKAQEFSVYPMKPDAEIATIQSDKSIGQFDRNGKGRLTTKGCYFHHLAFAEPYQFPADVVHAAFDIAPRADNEGYISIMDLIK